MADTLKGTGNDDYFTGGLGEDSIIGGGGTDTLIEARDADMTLVDADASLGTATLSIDGEVDDLQGITNVYLTGGAGVQTLDSSGYTQGTVTLASGGGADKLIGGMDTQFIADVTGIDASADASEKVYIKSSSLIYNLIMTGVEETITQSDLSKVVIYNEDDQAQTSITVERDGNIVLGSNLYTDGWDLTIIAKSITISGFTIDTSNGTDATGHHRNRCRRPDPES